jgi:hypothetical protein
MLTLISPAKTLDYQTPLTVEKYTQPALLVHSKALMPTCQALSPVDIARLMKVSDKIAGLNVARFAEWQPNFTLENARQAIFAFKGDVYTGLDALSLSLDDLEWAQARLRMLSGLYGALRPLDLMQAYRLEMGTKLTNPRGENLYQFWGNHITDNLNETLAMQNSQCVVNLASNEYFKSVNTRLLSGKIITPIFKDAKNGVYKIISFYAKKARGLMVRYIIDNRIDDPELLKEFDVAGYYFVPAESTETEWVFKREETK